MLLNHNHHFCHSVVLDILGRLLYPVETGLCVDSTPKSRCMYPEERVWSSSITPQLLFNILPSLPVSKQVHFLREWKDSCQRETCCARALRRCWQALYSHVFRLPRHTSVSSRTLVTCSVSSLAECWPTDASPSDQEVPLRVHVGGAAGCRWASCVVKIGRTFNTRTRHEQT